MGTFSALPWSSFPRATVVLLELSGFLGLIVLGWVLVQLMHLENALHYGQAQWLRQIQKQTRQLRTLRRMLERVQAQGGPSLSLPPSLRQQWRVAGWILTALSATPRARS